MSRRPAPSVRAALIMSGSTSIIAASVFSRMMKMQTMNVTNTTLVRRMASGIQAMDDTGRSSSTGAESSPRRVGCVPIARASGIPIMAETAYPRLARPRLLDRSMMSDPD
jgi:hypothetical protein